MNFRTYATLSLFAALAIAVIALAVREDSGGQSAAAAGISNQMLSENGIVPPGQPSSPAIVSIEVQGDSLGLFAAVSGLGGENDVSERSQQTSNQTEPGRLHWETIVASRGLTSDMTLYDWRHLVETGQTAAARKDISVILYDQTFTEIARFEATSAWPCRYEVGPVEATSLIVMETLSICHNGLVRVS